MGEIIRVYKVVSRNLTDMNGVNDYSDFPKVVADSRKRGIHFSDNPIEVFLWTHLFSKENTTKEDVKYLVLEIDSDDVFRSFPNESPAVKKCSVVREMNIDDILDFFNSDIFKKEFCSKVALDYIRLNSQKYWLDLKEKKDLLDADLLDYMRDKD